MPANNETKRYLTESEIESILMNSLEDIPLDGKRVLVIIPDGTRTMPLPLFFRLITQALAPRVRQLNFIVALGTHPPMSKAEILALLGLTEKEKSDLYAAIGLLQHEWQNPAALNKLGTLNSQEVKTLSQGFLEQEIPVVINRQCVEHNHLLVCGPVFPHEVIGFSGGNKYFYPGLAGSEIIQATHWLGALITSIQIIGKKDTPVRKIIDRASAMIPTPRHAICPVVSKDGVSGVFIGEPETAFSSAADLSAKEHIVWVEQPYQQVLSVLPQMYNELWVGAKGMYKVEPAVADGGEVILYGPHLDRISRTHGELIRKVGYHVRDYFLEQWQQYADIPQSILAHSTHLRGTGTFQNGIEKARIQVTLATAIPEKVCRKVNLGYRDPASIQLQDWAGRESEGVLLVPRAGEDLYRVKSE